MQACFEIPKFNIRMYLNLSLNFVGQQVRDLSYYMCFIPVYRRATYFQDYKILWIIGNLLQIFVDKFSRIKVIINIVTREKRI